MALGEFALIDHYFRSGSARRDDVVAGVGDDAALLRCPPDQQLVAAIDTLVDGVHFPPGSSPTSVGHRALAVNLSDLAAMGAQPAWALLALTLPAVDEAWLEAFASGFNALANEHGVALVGGDTTSGPLSISVQILGFAPPSTALLRSGGKPGDLVFVSGTTGDAAAGLHIEQGKLQVADHAHEDYLRHRFLFPTPRVALGRLLREYATACIDVSDGLFADASKLAAASNCGVDLQWEHAPVSPALVAAVGIEQAAQLAFTGGDDYELCFSVSPLEVERLQYAVAEARGVSIRPIGTLGKVPGARVLRDGTVMNLSARGFDHFGA